MSALVPVVDSVLLKNLDTTWYRAGETFHIHTSSHGPWACSSPYCVYIQDVETPANGGPAVIMKGAEPWRGK